MKLPDRFTTKINGATQLIIQAHPDATGEQIIKMLREAIKEIRRAA